MFGMFKEKVRQEQGEIMFPAPQSNITPVPVLSVGSGGSGFSLQDDVQNSIATSTAQVADFNRKLIADYHLKYITYVTRMQSGGVVSIQDQQVPVPPFAYQLSPPDVNGVVSYEIGILPVCPPGPAVTYNGGLGSVASGANLTEGTVDIGIRLGNSSYFQTGQKDTWPAGLMTGPQPDGHNYLKIGTIGSVTITWPDGSTGTHNGWYLQVS